jgi:MYXO-CTERM domain-containing protein
MSQTALAGSRPAGDGGYMRFGWLVVAWGFALRSPLVGCLSGQTGSPNCIGGRRSCICDPLVSAGTPLRVRVDRVETGRLEGVVEEVFPTSLAITGEVMVGDRVGGSLLAQQPCEREVVSTVPVHSELLVLYIPHYTQGGVMLLDGLFSWAVPWSKTLSFGGSIELPSSDVSAVLSSPQSCEARFPPKPPPPCHDTGSDFACSAAPGANPSGIGVGALLLGLTALLTGVRRRRR